MMREVSSLCVDMCDADILIEIDYDVPYIEIYDSI